MPGAFRVYQIVANDCRNGTYEMAAEWGPEWNCFCRGRDWRICWHSKPFSE